MLPEIGRRAMGSRAMLMFVGGFAISCGPVLAQEWNPPDPNDGQALMEILRPFCRPILASI